MTAVPWWARRSARRARSALIRLLARDSDGDPGRALLLVGTARSGTTWLGDLLADRLHARMLFEPFHPDRVAGAAPFGSMPYRREEEDDPALEEFCRSVFAGTLGGAWVDREARWLRPRARVVKSVRTALLLPWLRRRFPEVPFVVLVRDPVAVVRSRLAAGWSPDPDFFSLLGDGGLVADTLGGDAAWARGLATPEERSALVWALHYRVATAHADSDPRTATVRYEHLASDPDEEVARVLEALGLEPALPTRSSRRPSSTARKGRTPRQRAGARQGAPLEAALRGRVNEVVSRLGLAHLYGTGATATRSRTRGS